jgi:hypothetical protein
MLKTSFRAKLATEIVAVTSCLLLFASGTVAGAAEIRFLSPGSLQSAMSEHPLPRPS